jgi:hypothetical protein
LKMTFPPDFTVMMNAAAPPVLYAKLVMRLVPVWKITGTLKTAV